MITITLALEASSISKAFAGVKALKSVSLALLAGEVHAVIGENGAGKSTLIKIITGAVTPDEGTIKVRGEVVPHMDPRVSKALGIAAIYQQPSLFPDLTVAENIALALEGGSAWRVLDWKGRGRRARELLARAGTSLDPERRVATLSMPEQQLVEIAKAIGADARVVIMDEPTASLTEREVESLFQVIGRLRSEGVGVIYISHRLEEIEAVADRVTVLRDGESIATRRMDEVDRHELIHMMVGRELGSIFPKREIVPGDVVLELRNISNGVVRNISLNVRRGEILGIAGLVGSGRTQLAETIFGLTPADSGEMLLCGLSIAIGTPADAIRRGIGYVPEDRPRNGAILEMPVAANTSLADLKNVAHHGLIDRREERELAEGFVRQLRIKTPSVETETGALSGGNQQKVALARWLAIKPAMLILDEPTQGVDVGSKSEIHSLMADLAEQGLAIIMISSELPELLGMSDRIAVMQGGTIRGTLDRKHATQQAVLSLALGEEERSQKKGVRSQSGTNANNAKSGVRRSEISVALAIVALLIILGVVAPSFFTRENLSDLVLANMPVLIVALGMTLVILTGHIDISVGTMFAIASIAAGEFAKLGLPAWGAGLAACLVGAMLGAVNGALVAYVRIPSIVVTLAAMVAFRDALRWITQGAWVQDLPANFQWLGTAQTASNAITFVIAGGLAAGIGWSLRNLPAGRAVYATGSNANAARLVGIDAPLVTFSVFMITGALTGCAALLNSIRFNQIPSNAGIGMEMKVITAVVVGGTAITGGRGSIQGTLLGVILLGIISPALTFLGFSAYWERAIQGLIILFAVGFDAVRSRLGKYAGDFAERTA